MNSAKVKSIYSMPERRQIVAHISEFDLDLKPGCVVELATGSRKKRMECTALGNIEGDLALWLSVSPPDTYESVATLVDNNSGQPMWIRKVNT